jgi:hypothetical protein
VSGSGATPPTQDPQTMTDDEVSDKLHKIASSDSIFLENQTRMVKALEILTSDEKMAREIKVVTQQGLMLQTIEGVHAALNNTTEKLEDAGAKFQGIFWGLMKVPIVVVVVCAGSALFWIGKIEEHSWLIIMAVAVFPYLGDSISAVASLFGLGKRNGGGPLKILMLP